MIVYLRLAWRNVWRQRRRTLLIAIAMGIIMTLLVFYDGLLGGFEQAIYNNAIQLLGGNIQAHALGYNAKAARKPLLPIHNPNRVIKAAESHPDVIVASQRIVTGGMVTNREGAFAVSIIGIEPEKEALITPVAKTIIQGRYLQPEDGDAIVIGKGLAIAMNVDVGDRLTVVSNARNTQTRQRTMTVIGIYDVGVPSVEKTMIYLSLAAAQRLFRLEGQATEVIISLRRIGQEPTVIRALSQDLPEYELSSWEDSFPELKETMELKTSVMVMIGVFMLGIASIGIFNSLMMAVFERTREIGILGALGLRPFEISLIFLFEGVLIGLIGASLGAILGTLLNAFFAYYGMDYSAFTTLTEYTALISGRIYTQLVPHKIMQHALTVAIISALAALYPAIEASRREPAQALHYV